MRKQRFNGASLKALKFIKDLSLLIKRGLGPPIWAFPLLSPSINLSWKPLLHWAHIFIPFIAIFHSQQALNTLQAAQ